VILVDTSVWIDHFRSSNLKLATLLQKEEVCIHPFIIGELACGNLKERENILSLLQALPSTRRATDDEVLFFIKTHHIMGRGIGLIDAHLLASARLSACAFWTEDKRLKAVANKLGLSA
jgi:predicted nucleic acid-binding protein